MLFGLTEGKAEIRCGCYIYIKNSFFPKNTTKLQGILEQNNRAVPGLLQGNHHCNKCKLLWIKVSAN